MNLIENFMKYLYHQTGIHDKVVRMNFECINFQIPHDCYLII